MLGFGPLSSEKGSTFKDVCQKRGSSQGQNLALTVFCVPKSLDRV